MEEKKQRGFARLTPERRAAIAKMGGLAAQASGKAHKFTREQAIEAGRKGGLKVSGRVGHMSEIGKKGGSRSKGFRPVDILSAP